MRWENTATIDASVETIWRLTVDVEYLPLVTPTVTSAQRLDDGPVVIGSRTRLKQPGQRAAVWTVTDLVARRRFVWETSTMGIRVVGTHVLEDLGGSCRNTLAVELTGRGSGLLGRLLGGRLTKSIATENAAFKANAEQSRKSERA